MKNQSSGPDSELRIDLSLPKKWQDIKGKELVKLARIFLKRMEKPDFLIRCFLVFSGWKVLQWRDFFDEGKHQFWFKSGKKKFYIDSGLFHTLVSTLNFLCEKIELPAGNPQIKGYKACNHKLYNVSLETFLEADNFFNAFASTGKGVFLNKLFRTLYTKKRRLLLHRATRYEKYAVFLWFSGIKNFMVNKYPYLFAEGNGVEADPEEAILNLLSALNDGKPHDNERIFRTHVHECFYELNFKIENAPKK
nr:hypothetical protein [uncultured Draconibacterium sp.]